MQSRRRILSGIQASGRIHLGNFFGAMKQYLDLQEENESYIFIANYHALTTIKNGTELKNNTIDIAAHYLAIGLDPQKVCLFRHSDTPEVCELTWILSCVTPMGLLERCHSYKDKISKGIAAEHGLFAYPVLMAADILIFKPDLVPVGKDQKQHVEVARDLALKFNHHYGEILKVPEVSINKQTAIVPGVDGQKMSKSYQNCIYPFAGDKEIKSQVSKIVTDSTALEEPKDPDQCTVFALYKLMADETQVQTMSEKYRAGGYGYGHAKKELLALIHDYFDPAREKYQYLMQNQDYIMDVLKEGAARARQVAAATLREVRIAVGLE